MAKIKNILWGAVFILLGLVIGLNALEITSINIFFRGWWTLFIIVPCFIGLFKRGNKTGNIIGLLLGIALLLNARDIIEFDMMIKLAFPAILIIIGLSMIFKDSAKKNLEKEIKKAKENIKSDEMASNTYCAVFSGQDLNFANDTAKDCSLNAIFGGIKLDLRGADFEKDVYINACAVFGGIDIIIPENIIVKVKSTSVFGGVDNKKIPSNENDAHTVYIDATCLFGGVDIK